MFKRLFRVLEGKKRRHRRIVLTLGAAGSVAILAWLVAGHLGALQRVGAQVAWGWVAAAVAAALLSYVMIGLALAEVLALLGHRMPAAEVFGIGFVSTTANYFVSSAGISGFALKAHLLRKRGVPYGTTLTASVVSSAILYIVLAAIIGQGLVYLVLHLEGAKLAIMESALGLLVLAAVAVPALAFFFSKEARGRLTRKLFHWANRGVFLFSKSEIPKEDFEEFESQLEAGLQAVRRGHGRLTRTIFYTCADWGLSMATLHLCFRAVGIVLPVGHLSAGFTAGMAASLVPVLPGGLGVVEGSMAAVFQSLGVDWDAAFVAVLLFRLTYYALPGALSVLVLWGLKVSEPALIEDTVRDTLPEELRLRAKSLERRKHG